MKGLIISNLLSTRGSLKVLLFLTMVGSIAGLLTNPMAMQSIVAFAIISVFPMVYIQCYQKHSKSNWDKIELIMPVKRNSIVLAKYICFLIFLFMGCLIAGAYIFVSNLVIGNVAIWDTTLTNLMLLFTSIMVCAGTFFYPLIFKFGGERAESVLAILFILSLAPMYLAMQIGSRILGLDHMFNLYDYPNFWIIYSLLVTVLFIISYFISVQIYARKEL